MPQFAEWNNNAYEQATEIDENQLTYGTFLFLNSPSGNYTGSAGGNTLRPALPGINAPNLTISYDTAQQKKFNADIPVIATSINYLNSHLRFRHMQNTTLNALCVDGHVETRTVGTFTCVDICIKAPG